MNIYLFNLVLIITTAVQLVFQLLTTLLFFKHTTSKPKIIFGALFISIISLSLYFLHVNNMILIYFVSNAAGLLAYFLIFRFSFFKSAIAMLIQLILSTVIEYALTFILSVLIPNFNAGAFFMQSITKYILLRAIAITAWILVYVVIKKFFSKIEFISTTNSITNTLFVNLIFLAFLFIPNILFFEQTKIVLPSAIRIYNISLVLLMVIYGIYNILNIKNFETQKQELETQKLYNSALEVSLDKLRYFKHDLGNIISTIKGLTSLQRYDKLESYLNELHVEFTPLQSTNMLNDTIKNVPLLYGILLAKISLAEVNNVNFNIVILADKVDTDKIKLYHLGVILGIFLDNAIEAATESNSKFAKLSIRAENGRIVYEIINSFESEVDTEKIFEKEFTTKEAHSGLGLAEVQKIIEKYRKSKVNVSLETLKVNNTFVQRMTV